MTSNGDACHSSDSFTTRAIHVGSEPAEGDGAVVPDLSVATTYLQTGVGKHRGFEYSRSSNPTRERLERLISNLETCPSDECGEAETLVFASGSAATAAMCAWVTLPSSEGGAGALKDGLGGHVLAVNDVYGGTARYLSRTAKGSNLQVTYLDFEKAGEQGIRDALRPDTKLVWLELPTNPMLLMPPIKLIRKVLDSVSEPPMVVMDTTFLSSFYLTPIAHGGLADIVLSSLSKYSGGHSDLILGSLTVSSRVKEQVLGGLRFLQNSMGGVPSPRDCHLMIRSMKTLSVRALRHGLNALQVADWLSKSPKVGIVKYPGWKKSASFHMVEGILSPNAKKELEFLGWEFPYKEGKGGEGIAGVRNMGIPFGGVVTFTLKDATLEQTEKFMLNLRLILLAESLGGVESLIELPYGMTHQGLPAETKEALGITPNLVRLSVGIEDVQDLLEDLQQAMDSI